MISISETLVLLLVASRTAHGASLPQQQNEIEARDIGSIDVDPQNVDFQGDGGLDIDARDIDSLAFEALDVEARDIEDPYAQNPYAPDLDDEDLDIEARSIEDTYAQNPYAPDLDDEDLDIEARGNTKRATTHPKQDPNSMTPFMRCFTKIKGYPNIRKQDAHKCLLQSNSTDKARRSDSIDADHISLNQRDAMGVLGDYITPICPANMGNLIPGSNFLTTSILQSWEPTVCGKLYDATTMTLPYGTLIKTLIDSRHSIEPLGPWAWQSRGQAKMVISVLTYTADLFTDKTKFIQACVDAMDAGRSVCSVERKRGLEKEQAQAPFTTKLAFDGLKKMWGKRDTKKDTSKSTTSKAPKPTPDSKKAPKKAPKTSDQNQDKDVTIINVEYFNEAPP